MVKGLNINLKQALETGPDRRESKLKKATRPASVLIYWPFSEALQKLKGENNITNKQKQENNKNTFTSPKEVSICIPGNVEGLAKDAVTLLQ